MNTELTKRGPGRPVGKKVNLDGIDGLWKTHSNKELSIKYDTSIPNIWGKRQQAAKKGVDSVYIKTGKEVKKISLDEIVEDFGM